MAETFVDLVTPPSSPGIEAQLEDDAPQVGEGGPPPQADDEPPQVGEGGPGGLFQLDRGARGVYSSVKVHVVSPKDWCPREGGDLDAELWYGECMVKHPRIKFSHKTPLANQGLPYLFPKIPRDVDDRTFVVLVLTAHTAPAAGDVSLPPSHSRQYISFADQGAMAYKTFEEVAAAIKNTIPGGVKSKGRKYDLIVLACCQGHLFRRLIMPAMSKEGCIVFFGKDGEEPTDGVSMFLAQDLVEKLLEILSDSIKADKAIVVRDVLAELYTTVGEDYVGPEADQMKKSLSGEYEYCTMYLDRSANAARGAPGFVEGYTFAGNLNMLTANDEEDLVTPELVERRRMHMAACLQKANDEYVEKRAKAAKRPLA